jgi:hypothetical protein
MRGLGIRSNHGCGSLESRIRIAGAYALLATVAILLLFHANTGPAWTRNAIRLSLIWYAATLFALIKIDPQDWLQNSAAVRLARGFWSCGLLLYLAHFALAFHFYHHWSHDDAFARTRQISGQGEGIYVSYLFTIVWIADVLWWWAAPQAYALRSRWVDRMLHGFMLFIVFNGTIVFEAGLLRATAIVMFLAVVAAWILALRRCELQMEPGDRRSETVAEARSTP